MFIAHERAQSGKRWIERNLTVGRLVPATLLVWASADLAFRLLPPDSMMTLKPFQAAHQYPRRYAPFIPNLRIPQAHYVGSDAIAGNLLPDERRAPMLFTTNWLGFRHTPGVSPGVSPEVLVFKGASFNFGAELSDEESFAASLTKEIGKACFSAGRFGWEPERPRELEWLLAELRAKPREVVYLYLEEFREVLPPGHLNGLPEQLTKLPGHRNLVDTGLHLNRSVRAWLRTSPLKALVTRANNRLENDRLLPNARQERTHLRHLPNGARVLFRQAEKEIYMQRPSAEEIESRLGYVQWWADQFAARGMRTTVVLIPMKLSVYDEWLLSPEERAHGGSSLDKVEAGLVRRGINTVNGLTVLRSYARADVARGKLSYYREDLHWNALGVRRIALETIERMRASHNPLLAAK